MATAPSKNSTCEVLSRAKLRGRAGVTVREAIIKGVLVSCGSISILVTATILIVLTRETYTFFTMPEVSTREFFLTSKWSPLLGSKAHFGIWSLISGTMLVTAVAMALAGTAFTPVWPGTVVPAK